MAKHRYKLSSGITETIRNPLFSNEKEAWEKLRLRFKESPRYVTLYKQVIIDLPIINRDQCVKRYNKIYTLQKIGKENKREYWIPILWGYTEHKYRNLK